MVQNSLSPSSRGASLFISVTMKHAYTYKKIPSQTMAGLAKDKHQAATHGTKVLGRTFCSYCSI